MVLFTQALAQKNAFGGQSNLMRRSLDDLLFSLRILQVGCCEGHQGGGALTGGRPPHEATEEVVRHWRPLPAAQLGHRQRNGRPHQDCHAEA